MISERKRLLSRFVTGYEEKLCWKLSQAPFSGLDGPLFTKVGDFIVVFLLQEMEWGKKKKMCVFLQCLKV